MNIWTYVPFQFQLHSCSVLVCIFLSQRGLELSFVLIMSKSQSVKNLSCLSQSFRIRVVDLNEL